MGRTHKTSCRRETSVLSLKSVNGDISHQRTNPSMLLTVLRAKRETEDGFVPRSIDADDSDVEVNSDEASDDEEALLAELERIKKEKAEEKLRQWDDDVVFKNQVRGETKPQKCFIKDTIRNDFHRKFLLKYIK
ncbi:hypothetical protein GOBAR_AA03663 [Gossypium barbadense]|uniref:Cwf15/Cwc15 cell cycle control protein n=1 Tax=Gossypium barbadense TaxID=3634 RepID=A0A2P5YMT6_GOSBA|nr:hypothetical protein GOBAR_AA03663 [Gossypium barbadense]